MNENVSIEEIKKPKYPVYRLPFPHDPLAEVSRRVHGPSKRTEQIYDGKRKLMSDAFDFCDNIESLVSIIIRFLVKTYKGGQLDASLTERNRILFGELLDTELPIEIVVLFNNDTYWRRVVQKKTKYMFTHLNETRANEFSYKKLGLKMKFIELIENTVPELWDTNYFKELSRQLTPFITKLNINQLQSRSQLLLDKNLHVNAEYRIRNYPIDECDHGDLSFLYKLRNLQELSLEFAVKDLGFGYQKRYFDFSYKDIDILSIALSKMPLLKSFAIRRSLFSRRKIESLMRGLSKCSCLEKLELSCCQLTSTEAIGKFLCARHTLKALELKGNYLSGNELVDLAKAINQYEGDLCFLSLSENPLQSIGLNLILNNLLNTKQVSELDISGCVFSADVIPNIINFVKSHEILRSINLTAIPLMQTNGENLVKVLRNHYGIIHLQHKSCGLSEMQEMNLRILLERNSYYEANPILLNNEIMPEQEKKIDLIMKSRIHPLLADKIMPEFFQEDELRDNKDFTAIDENYPQHLYTAREFVDYVGFY